MQRSGEANLRHLHKRNNRTSEGLLHGFWAVDWNSSGGQIA
jgi:hypothetical protein